MNNDQIFFSIVIPVYNQADNIQKTLESVFSQRKDDYEIIVVDDGSTDSTPEILSKYNNQIQYIRQENKGPGMARNTAIPYAIGKYITFLDSDDLWFPWTLEIYHRVIQKYDLPSIVSGTHIDFIAEEELDRVYEEPCSEFYYKDYLSTANDGLWLGTCGTAIRRDILANKPLFSAADINAEDSDLWLSLGTSPGFIRVNTPALFAYRRRSNSRVYDLQRTVMGNMNMINRENRNEYPGAMARRLDRLKIITRHTRPVIISCIKNGRIKDALHLYKMTFLWHLVLLRFRFILGIPFLVMISFLKGFDN